MTGTSAGCKVCNHTVVTGNVRCKEVIPKEVAGQRGGMVLMAAKGALREMCADHLLKKSAVACVSLGKVHLLLC